MDDVHGIMMLWDACIVCTRHLHHTSSCFLFPVHDHALLLCSPSIPNAVRRTTDKDRAGAQLAVQEDRKHAIEAAIVRVMKARKQLNHQQLISEVSAQLMQFFQPDPRAIKK